MEAIGHAGAAIGILGTDGVVRDATERTPLTTFGFERVCRGRCLRPHGAQVLAAEKKTTSKLLESDKVSPSAAFWLLVDLCRVA